MTDELLKEKLDELGRSALQVERQILELRSRLVLVLDTLITYLEPLRDAIETVQDADEGAFDLSPAARKLLMLILETAEHHAGLRLTEKLDEDADKDVAALLDNLQAVGQVTMHFTNTTAEDLGLPDDQYRAVRGATTYAGVLIMLGQRVDWHNRALQQVREWIELVKQAPRKS